MTASNGTRVCSLSDQSKCEIEMVVDRFYSVVGIRWEVRNLTSTGSRYDLDSFGLLENIVINLFDIQADFESLARTEPPCRILDITWIRKQGIALTLVSVRSRLTSVR
jgi:hypothetical protein